MPDDLTAMADVESAITARLRAAGCVFAEEESRLLVATASSPDELDTMVSRRVDGLPLEHVVGWAEFCGLRISVGPGVFVPRRRSELLVRHAVAILTASAATAATRAGTGQVLLDLCCGSGAIGLAVATGVQAADPQRPRAELHASDIDTDATAYARRNLAAIGGHVHEGDLYEALPAELSGRFAIIAVNAPYVPSDEIALMPAEARLHEPLIALDGGRDGVALHRRIAAGAPQWLSPGGSLLIETSERQSALTAAAMAAAGLATRTVSDDELESTVVIGHT